MIAVGVAIAIALALRLPDYRKELGHPAPAAGAVAPPARAEGDPGRTPPIPLAGTQAAREPARPQAGSKPPDPQANAPRQQAARAAERIARTQHLQRLHLELALMEGLSVTRTVDAYFDRTGRCASNGMGGVRVAEGYAGAAHDRIVVGSSGPGRCALEIRATIPGPEARIWLERAGSGRWGCKTNLPLRLATVCEPVNRTGQFGRAA